MKKFIIIKKAMLDKIPILVDQKKRYKHFHKLNMEEVNVLRSSENAEYLAREFDRIFLKIQRLISYSINKNRNERLKLEEDTNNLLRKFSNYIKGKVLDRKSKDEQRAIFNDLLRKFSNYIKGKVLDRKSKDEQRAIFNDICGFINFFDGDSYFSRIHNSLAKTRLSEYKDKTVGEQFFQTSYGREWKEGMPEGGSCSYWTILLYNFFNKLKEAGLDLEIKFFRYKNLDDKIVNFPSMRHSGLIVTFQGEDYFVDHDGIQLRGNNEPIVRKVQPYIDYAKEISKHGIVVDFFENFKHKNMKETDKVIFFDDINDFISHVEKYPEYQKISFYRKNWNGEPDKLNYEFKKNGIGVAVNDQRHIFYLSDNNISKNGFPKNIMNKIKFLDNGSGAHPATKEDKKLFEEYFDLVSDKINIEWLYNHFTSGGKWESVLVDFFGTNKVLLMK